jgi:hypothetical protein
LIFRRTAANPAEPKDANAPSIQSLITWHYEPGSLTPLGKVVQRFTPKGEVESTKHYSVLTDHLGTPTELIDDKNLPTLTIGARSGGPPICRFRWRAQAAAPLGGGYVRPQYLANHV